jgi:tetratricopeptide (TPR) repeat protein
LRGGASGAVLNHLKERFSWVLNPHKIHSLQNQPYPDRSAAWLVDLRRYEEALSDFEKATEINPEFVDAYQNRAELFLTLRKYQEALSDLNKVIELNPRNDKIRSEIERINGILNTGGLE